jgi:multiple sugar transport system substrate-binding protein
MKYGRPRGLSRRDFLKVGGAGLAGAAFLGAAGCGGGEQGGGATEIYFTSAPDESGTTQKLIDMFNDKNKGKYKVIFHQGNADTGQRFDKLRTQMQAGGEDLDVILGDVIWTAQLAESDWISDLSDRFTESQRKEFLPGSPVVPLAQEALQHTRPRPVSPYYLDMSLEMAEQFNASLSGDISPEEAARTLKEQLERFIKEGQKT